MKKRTNGTRTISTQTLPFDRPVATESLRLLKSEDSTRKKIKPQEVSAQGSDPADYGNYKAMEAVIEPEETPALLIKKKHIINKLNFMNFQDQAIAIHFKQGGNRPLCYSVPAMPKPCSWERFSCTWCNSGEICRITDPTFFSHIEIRTDNAHLTAEPDLISFNSSGIELDLNEKCFQWPMAGDSVQAKDGLKVRLTQNGSVFEGIFSEFSSEKLGIQLYFKPPQTPLWIDDSTGVNLTIYDDSGSFYSGECRVLELSRHATKANLMLTPCLQRVPRFKPTKYRSIRHTLLPAPNIGFVHPLTGKPSVFKVIDISGSGVCVEDHAECPVLLPGMTISRLRIEFSHNSSIECQAQVVYSDKTTEEENAPIQVGIALLDINFGDFVQLSSLLHQAEDEKAFVCRQIDTDALWEFFFETGFIYPGKYEHFQKKKKEIKKVYEKLYTKSPQIAAHFTYQDKGKILGHMSMLRLYDRAWMIHHHAARKTSLVKAGVAVLKQIGRFTYDGHRFRSSHMDYLFCYYRPDNLFPAFVFGGAVSAINHRRQCSEDTFAYLHVSGSTAQTDSLDHPWTLEDAEPGDSFLLEHYYEQVSGGLMTHALDLHQGFEERAGLEQEYEHYGFSKQKKILALKKSGRLMAVALVNQTDTGLNMSDLTNSIKMVVLEDGGLDKDILMAAAGRIADAFPGGDVPLLVYPLSYAESVGLDIEKKYNLWILKTQYSDKYFAHMEKLFKDHLKQ